MIRSAYRGCAIALALALFLAVQAPAYAAPIPSKAPDRRTDQATVEGILEHEEVADTLVSFGLGLDEVEDRLAKLSDEDLRHLASNLEQIQAAGEEVPEYIWWLAGGLLAVLILAALF